MKQERQLSLMIPVLSLAQHRFCGMAVAISARRDIYILPEMVNMIRYQVRNRLISFLTNLFQIGAGVFMQNI